VGLMEEAVSLSGSNMLTSHLVSLDLALALRDAGYPQQATFFRWIRPEGPQLTPVQKFAEQDGFILTDTNYSFPEEWEHYSAPLASELMEKMPEKTWMQKVEQFEGEGCTWIAQCSFRAKGTKYITYSNMGVIEDDHKAHRLIGVRERLPQDALATLYLHLRKASLI
jgi:hypothetical protein